MQENKSDNTSIVGPAKEGSKKKVKPARSCLDALWSLLQQSQDLAVNDPFILAKALQVVAALWQSGGPGASSLALLQQQDGFWKMLVGVIEGGVGADAAFAVPADRGAQQPAAWTELRNDCWRVTAEAYALQIIAGELFAWAAAAGSEESNQSAKGGTAPPEVADFATNRVAAVLPYLLERYCKLLPTSSVVADTQRVAAAAGLQLLSTAVENEVLWVTLQSGSSLVSSLSALVQPSLARCGSSGEAAAELVRQYNDLLAEGGRLQTPALRAVAELMLAQAEVPPRVASDGEYGAAFVYDAALFGRRVGAALAHEASLLGDLREWLGACSIAVSLEDARLTAALAVDALVRVMDGQVGTAPKAGQRLKLAASTEHFMSALDVLDAAVEAVVQEAKAAAAPLDSSTPSVPAIDAKEVHVSSLAAAAQVCLVLCARHRPNDHAIATSLVARSLQSASVWLSADQDVARVDADAAGRTTKCLLAIALHSVSAASPKVKPDSSKLHPVYPK